MGEPFRFDVDGVQFNVSDGLPDDMAPEHEGDLARVLADWFKEGNPENPNTGIAIRIGDGKPRGFRIQMIEHPAPDRTIVHLVADAWIEPFTIMIGSSEEGGDDHA